MEPSSQPICIQCSSPLQPGQPICRTCGAAPAGAPPRDQAARRLLILEKASFWLEKALGEELSRTSHRLAGILKEKKDRNSRMAVLQERQLSA